MVLEELSQKLTASLRKLSGVQTVNEQLLDEILGDLMRALLEADVNAKVCMDLRTKIKERVNMDDLEDSHHTHKARIVQKIMISELVKIVDSETEPYLMRKGLKREN